MRARASTASRRPLHCQAAQKAVPIDPPYRVLITGSTKGVGLAMAQEFLANGDHIVVSSRSEERVMEAIEKLGKKHEGRVHGYACNVASPSDVAALADFGKEKLGKIDIWINNAGSNAYKYGPLFDSDGEDLEEIVATNVLGVMLGCKEAVRIMREQESGGHVFNMDGAGADGNATPRFAAYGATKRSLGQLSKSLVAELNEASIKHVGIHNLSPGMVTTELLMSGATTPTAKFFINCLAEPAEVVAKEIVPKIRRVPQDAVNVSQGKISPTYIQFLTKSKAYTGIFSRLLMGRNKDRYVPE